MSSIKRFARKTILPAPACDLLDRLTGELDVPFTLTDLHGTVVASTAGARVGEVDARAAVRHGAAVEVVTVEAGTSPRVYVPLHLSEHHAGTLVAHGDPARVEATARVAAVAVGLALDFAEAASSLGHDSVSPGWLLYRLLRGSPADAQQARLMASILGWELFVQRVAVVVEVRAPRGAGDPRGPRPAEVLDRVLGGPGRTPYGQIGEGEWVVLVHHEPDMPWPRVRQLAETLQRELSRDGSYVAVGVGEPHLPVQPVAALRRSYREAGYALRLGVQMSRGPGVFELRALGPASFFAPSSPSRRKLASLVLDPLAAQEGLLPTLRAYLSRDMSVAATAAHLGLHRHTVRNHLERVAELTGLDPRTLDGAVQLKLALLVAATDADRWGR